MSSLKRKETKMLTELNITDFGFENPQIDNKAIAKWNITRTHSCGYVPPDREWFIHWLVLMLETETTYDEDFTHGFKNSFISIRSEDNTIFEIDLLSGLSPHYVPSIPITKEDTLVPYFPEIPKNHEVYSLYLPIPFCFNPRQNYHIELTSLDLTRCNFFMYGQIKNTLVY